MSDLYSCLFWGLKDAPSLNHPDDTARVIYIDLIRTEGSGGHRGRRERKLGCCGQINNA